MAILQANKDYYLLRKQAYIVKFLDRIKYPDSKRISSEIIQFVENKYAKKVKRDHQNMPENSVNKSIDKKVEEILVRLDNGEPWEYIRGMCEFHGYLFKVKKDVLIPRIETEELVNIALKEISLFLLSHKDSNITLIDVGTGSGCIAITLSLLLKNFCLQNNLKRKRNQIRIFATDISSKALQVAKQNAKSLHVKPQISFLRTDLIEELHTEPIMNNLTFILSNPPYIPTPIVSKLHKSVREYEPINALDGGNDGTRYYRNLLDQIKLKDLIPKAIFFEIDPVIESRIKKLAKTNHYISEIKADYRGQARYAVLQVIQ